MSLLERGTLITEANHAEWLAKKRQGRTIGASEAAMAIGIAPESWSNATPVDLWMRKTGRAMPVATSPEMEWGLLLEPLVLAKYERWSGFKVENRQLAIRHPTVPYLAATLDGTAEDESILVEAKTASAFAHGWGEPGTAEIPEPYLIQVNLGMEVTNLRYAEVPVLFGGQRFEVYRVHRDDELIEAMMPRLAEFQRCVETDTPPTWGRMDAHALAILHPNCVGTIELDAATQHKVLTYESLGETIKAKEEEREALKSEILAAMGDGQIAELSDGRRVKRYLEEISEKVVSYTAKAYTKHYLRILKGR